MVGGELVSAIDTHPVGTAITEPTDGDALAFDEHTDSGGLCWWYQCFLTLHHLREPLDEGHLADRLLGPAHRPLEDGVGLVGAAFEVSADRGQCRIARHLGAFHRMLRMRHAVADNGHDLSALSKAEDEEVLVFVVRRADVGDTRHFRGQHVCEVMTPGEQAAVPALCAETVIVDGVRSCTTCGASQLRISYAGGRGCHCLQG